VNDEYVRIDAPVIYHDGTDLYDGVTPPDHVPGSPPNIWSLHAQATAATRPPGGEALPRSSGDSSFPRITAGEVKSEPGGSA
jgi:hypothetical protein